MNSPIFRVGHGLDVHPFASGRKLILGGVEIPFESGLQGHSDADVLLHAICDALLGAAGMGDIGRHFPDSDPAYAGISSRLLLQQVAQLLAKEHWSISNIDATVIVQRPRLAPYIVDMETNISTCIDCAAEKINIKATTTEKLGFVGRGEGITAEAIVLLYKKIGH